MKSKYKPYCYEGAIPSIVINKADNLTKEQTLTILKKLRTAIAQGMPLEYEDSEQTGNKYTYCSWGVCTDSTEIYNKAEYHTFPKSFDENGRDSALSLAKGVLCPILLERASDTESDKLSGCFWRCRIFQHKFKTPSRKKALELYDEKITALKNSIKETL